MISVGVQFKGGDINITTETNLFHSFTAVTNIVFAYCEFPFGLPVLSNGLLTSTRCPCRVLWSHC